MLLKKIKFLLVLSTKLKKTQIFYYNSRTGQEPISLPGCEHCPTGVPCDPVTGACAKGMCDFFYPE